MKVVGITGNYHFRLNYSFFILLLHSFLDLLVFALCIWYLIYLTFPLWLVSSISVRYYSCKVKLGMSLLHGVHAIMLSSIDKAKEGLHAFFKCFMFHV